MASCGSTELVDIPGAPKIVTMDHGSRSNINVLYKPYTEEMYTRKGSCRSPDQTVDWSLYIYIYTYNWI